MNPLWIALAVAVTLVLPDGVVGLARRLRRPRRASAAAPAVPEASAASAPDAINSEANG